MFIFFIKVCVFSCIDNSHRLRTDRILNSKPWIFAKKDELLSRIKRAMIGLKDILLRCFTKRHTTDNSDEAPLLLN